MNPLLDSAAYSKGILWYQTDFADESKTVNQTVEEVFDCSIVYPQYLVSLSVEYKRKKCNFSDPAKNKSTSCIPTPHLH